jgi:hypothetical protein
VAKHIVHREIEINPVEGVAAELHHALRPSWTFTRELDSFVVRGPIEEGLDDEVWRVVRFLAYPAFCVLERTRRTEDEVRYELVSSTAGSQGFRVVFILSRQAASGIQ